jgi:hypothetical protein
MSANGAIFITPTVYTEQNGSANVGSIGAWKAAEPSSATPEILGKNGDQGGCSGRTKKHTAQPAKDKKSNRIRTCCLTSDTWPPAMKQKGYS